MKECPNCKEILGDKVEVCYACRYDFSKKRCLTMDEARQRREDRQKQIETKQNEMEEREKCLQRDVLKRNKIIEEIKNNQIRFLCSTGYNFEGYSIIDYIDILTTEVTLGTGMLSEVSMTITDMLGEKSNTLERKIKYAKDKALQELKAQAIEKCSNAIIGVTYNLMMLNNNMIIVSANGTAVFVEKIV
ncbi:MAG: heavy metal-binding domain-containing protein [Butyribacter sp.]|nr:heavy metal-binding domain-containing protein [Butyribacter sp.]